ncbi:hypothetical protein [Pseudodesulfovibrio piezophilus]|uniref:Uncharacterized protein n=1 Tax=Pseudodesulfovibrio piezophilus (strain DSM 21447 / JCM 15486 / C1TLV30) TaxID=1322246 RepID=M1WM52_PSEP2|nr:hypothetical protein [Pseudodesulfovibrio piezophilus]CCH49000.1 conserved protein of unknown function [Pseudodesulfovibrio piezophilus C1TLV30]
MAEKQFELFLTEVRAGWLEARIVHDGEHYDLSVSCSFSEPLKDLFSCLCDLYQLEALPDLLEDYRHFEFEWGGEGWLYYWTIIPGPGGVLQVDIEFKGKREAGGVEHPVWSISAMTDWQTLAGQVFTQTSEMLWMYGFSGYYDRWSKDFPAGKMMRLGHLLHGQARDTDDFSRELGYLAETR